MTKEEVLKNRAMEVCTIAHTNATLVINSLVSEAGSGNDVTPPLMLYSKPSRFRFAILSDTSVFTNVKTSEIAGLEAKTRGCIGEEIHRSLKSVKVPESPAYTQVLSGKYRGKTPAQVLLEAGEKSVEACEELNNQYIWLRESSKRNPKYASANQRQMDAIADAAQLFKKGELCKEDTKGTYVLFPNTPHPDTNKVRNDGKCFVHECSVEWHFGAKAPVSLTISNYYSAFVVKENGLRNIRGEKSDEKKYSISLTDNEWIYLLDAIRTNMRIFEDSIGDKSLATANAARSRNINAIK